MHYCILVIDFQKFLPQRHFTFDFGDLKLRDLAKLWFFKLIMTKSNFWKIAFSLFTWSKQKWLVWRAGFYPANQSNL